MRHGGVHLAIAGVFGIGLFVAIFFLVPKPQDLSFPVFFKVPLPQAEDKPLNTPDETEATGTATLSFVGDIMLARSVEATIAEQGASWPFQNLGNVFADSDAVIGNFEGTVRDERNIEVVNQMVFDTTPDNVAILTNAGFTHLSLANNHADDYGAAITLKTREVIEANNIIPFGDPLNSGKFITRENIDGIEVSIIGFHAFGEDTTSIISAIQREKEQGRFVIVYPHWGIEYVVVAPTAETLTAKKFVNAGADLIIGGHPHVIQNVEVIDGVPVVYSLGNFLFDQDFSKDTQQGLIAKVNITETEINIHFIPVSIKNRQTFIMNDEAALEVLTQLGYPDGHLRLPRQQAELTQSAL